MMVNAATAQWGRIVMTDNGMSALEHARAARDLLDASDREFDAGDYLQGSESLYWAATQAVMAVCQQRDWAYDNRRAVKEAVGKIARAQGELLIVGGFSAAENFHRNFIHDYMEDYVREADRPAVHHFVNLLLALVDGDVGSGP